MPTYSVVLYINRTAMTFSVTARKMVGARLAEVDRQQSRNGFTPQLVLGGLAEAAAKRLKRLTVAQTKTAGFRKVPREAL